MCRMPTNSSRVLWESRTIQIIEPICSTAGSPISITNETMPGFLTTSVLMDIRLARGTDGIQAAGEIRTRFDIASLYLSAHTDAATLNRAQATQPLGFIAKPYTHAQLEAALRAAVAVLRGGLIQ